MKPKLNKDLNNSSDSEDDSELEISSDDNISVKKKRRRRKGIMQLPPLEEVPEYRKIAERKNAQSSFDLYLKLFELMIEMEPKLFKKAVKTLKRHDKNFKIDYKQMKMYKVLYPETIPDVFMRLWK